MRGTMQWLNSALLMLGVCVLVGSVSTNAVSPSNSDATTNTSEPTPTWDKKLAGTSRFTVLSAFSDAAVRDDETGLVWEKTLDTTEMSWTDARVVCADKDVGGRKGWRLPSISELTSLVDPSVRSGPTLPSGHPFANVLTDVYWSATSVTDNPKNAWLVFFDTGKATFAFKTITFHVWCVRGAMPAGQY